MELAIEGGTLEEQHTADIPPIELNQSKNERFELLVLSEAGKPIYSYTKREDAVTLMPLCSALINYASKVQKEAIRSIETSDRLIIHLYTRSPLIIIVIHETYSFIDPRTLVEQVEAQLISILTAKTLKSVFEERPTFDLKRLLYGSEKLIDATARLCMFPKKLAYPWVAAFLAVQSVSTTSAAVQSKPHSGLNNSHRPHRILVPLFITPPSIRDSIQNIIQNVISSTSKNMVFSLLFRTTHESTDRFSEKSSASSTYQDASSQTTREELQQIQYDVSGFELITVCNHHDKHKIHVADIHIILALLCGFRAQLASVESIWVPICLPKFNQDAFLHSYIAYTSDAKLCIVLMCTDRDKFNSCQQSRNLIEDKLNIFMKEPSHKTKLNYQLSPLVQESLLHKQNRLNDEELTDTERAELEQEIKSLNPKQDEFHTRKLQFLWYQTNKQVFWWQRSTKNPMNSIIYYVAKKMFQLSLKHLWLKISDETVCLGWHLPSFQVYAQFDSSISTNEATEAIQRIINWIKKEEDNFSIKDYT